MSRFIEIGDELVNVDCIVMAAQLDEKLIGVTLTNGEMFEADASAWRMIRGDDHIVAIYSCNQLFAIMDRDGDLVPYPVALLALTASGKLRPLDENFEFLEDTIGGRFVEFASGAEN